MTENEVDKLVSQGVSLAEARKIVAERRRLRRRLEEATETREPRPAEHARPK